MDVWKGNTMFSESVPNTWNSFSNTYTWKLGPMYNQVVNLLTKELWVWFHLSLPPPKKFAMQSFLSTYVLFGSIAKGPDFEFVDWNYSF